MPAAVNGLDRMDYDGLMRIKPLLDEIADQVEQPDYITRDPVCFMHGFDEKRDRELAGFFAATLAWGRRDIVLNKMENLLSRMNYKPYEFISNFTERDRCLLRGFRHRTFKENDIYWFIKVLSGIMRQYGSFEHFWKTCYEDSKRQSRELLALFHERFMAMDDRIPVRMRKHVSNPEKSSSCKRLYLYLRWCVRKNSLVDTGIMDFISPAELMIPLDVHVARQARRLGLLARRQNDWKAVMELTSRLRKMNPDDPVKYDYALFGIGVDGYKLPDHVILNTSI